jgi:hypothetical protein
MSPRGDRRTVDMPTIEELDALIAEKDQELIPLTSAAGSAQDRCLERIAEELAVKIEAHAKGVAERHPSATATLQDERRLTELRVALRTLAAESKNQVETCLRSAEPWVHLHPERPRYWDQEFTNHVGNRHDQLPSGWSAALKCLSGPLDTLLANSGYPHEELRLTHAEWSADLWGALALYADDARALMTVRFARQELKRERDRLAAANAWESAG